MEAASGLVTLVNLVLCLIVGTRLLRTADARTGVPELSLGVYFVASAFLSSIPQIVVYGSLGRDSFALSEPVIQACLGAAVLLMAIGGMGLYIFTLWTFRPNTRWAMALTFLGFSALFGGWILEAFTDGFRLMIFPGLGHWIGWAGRTGSALWIALESFHYWVQQRRRLRIGLADAFLANRFLLWALWSTTAFFNLAADLAARVVYVSMAGSSTEFVADIVQPVVFVTITVTMALGVVSAATLFLTFFAPARYREWIQSRAEQRAA